MVKPGIVSATVGTSGNCGERSVVDIARRRALPIRTGSMTSEILPKNIWTVPANNAAIVKTLGSLGIDAVNATGDELAQTIQADITLFRVALDAAGLLRTQTAR